MTTEEKYAYWLELARYDLDTAVAMFSTGRWFYVVFMCQQAVEKCCKGLYTLYIDDNVPKIHNIKTIVSRFKDKLPIAISEDTLCFLIPFPLGISHIGIPILNVIRIVKSAKTRQNEF